MRDWLTRVLAGLSVVLLLALGSPATAQEITLGLGAAITSLDPHFHNLASNTKIALPLFARLVDQDERMRPIPGLASEWKAVDDTTWEFKLRPGVKFHDGSDLTAEDVAATIRRVN